MFWIRKGPEPMRVSPNETAKDTDTHGESQVAMEVETGGCGDWGM